MGLLLPTRVLTTDPTPGSNLVRGLAWVLGPHSVWPLCNVRGPGRGTGDGLHLIVVTELGPLHRVVLHPLHVSTAGKRGAGYEAS